MPTITILYAGLLGLVAVGLASHCGVVRGRTGVDTGDGDDLDVVIAMRRHANFVEYVPLLLILIGLLEMNGVASTAIHTFGSVLLVARLCHAFGFTSSHPTHPLRIAGAIGTTLTLVVTSIWAIVIAV